MSAPNSASVASRRQHFTSGLVPLRPTPLMRALRLALTVMSDGVRPELRQPQAFKNAPNLDRSCPTDRLAVMIDDVCDALTAAPVSPTQRLEQALSLSRTIEAHVRAKLAPAPALSLKEHALQVSRTDAAGDMTLAEYLANPNDPSIALRAAEMAAHESREHQGLADRLRAAFHLRPRGSAA